MGLLDEGVPVGNLSKKLITVLYGPPGIGKTILATRTANKTALYTDENAYVSLTQFPELAERVTIFNHKSYSYLTGLLKELYQGDHDFDHFMIDTFDGIIRSKLKEQRAKIDFNRHKSTNDINSLEDYNLLNNHMFDLITRLTMLPCSVTLTSHDRIPDEKSHAKGDRLLRPSIPFRVFECLNGYANVVGYVDITRKNGNEVRTVSVSPNSRHEAKNHLKMNPVVTDDEFVEIIRNWKGI